MLEAEEIGDVEEEKLAHGLKRWFAWALLAFAPNRLRAVFISEVATVVIRQLEERAATDPALLFAMAGDEKARARVRGIAARVVAHGPKKPRRRKPKRDRARYERERRYSKRIAAQGLLDLAESAPDDLADQAA